MDGALQEIALTASAPAAGRRPRRRGRPSKRDVARAIEDVARRLGNTPTVCRKCYVHPEVIASFMDETLVPALKGRAVATAARAASGASSGGLCAEEAAVLALLLRRAAEEKRGRRLQTQLRRSLRVVRA